MRVILSLLVLTLVTGCLSNPSPLPMGSARAHEKYKTAPGPKPKDIGYEYNSARHEVILQAWEETAAKLVHALEQKTGLHPQPIFIAETPADTAFYITLDHALRQEFRSKGYRLVNSSRNVPAIMSDARVPNKNDGYPTGVNMTEPYGDMVLILDVVKNNQITGGIAQIHNVPLYGFYDPQHPPYGYSFGTGKRYN